MVGQIEMFSPTRGALACVAALEFIVNTPLQISKSASQPRQLCQDVKRRSAAILSFGVLALTFSPDDCSMTLIRLLRSKIPFTIYPLSTVYNIIIPL